MIVPIVLTQAANDAIDLAAVTSRAKARVLAMRGKLVQTWLFPRDFGGPPDRANELFVPPEAARRIEALIAQLLAERGDTRRTMTVHPDHRGDSIVPTSITYTIHPGTDRVTIPIW
jgi:hypothetical protein